MTPRAGAAARPPLRAFADQLASAWSETRDESQAAYRHWCDAPATQRRLAYAVFLAATDREAAAEQAFLVAVGRA